MYVCIYNQEQSTQGVAITAPVAALVAAEPTRKWRYTVKICL